MFIALFLLFGVGHCLIKDRHWLGFGIEDIYTGDKNENYFTQKVSHFNPKNVDTFQQRYFLNDTFYAAGGPLFVVLGGEAPEDARVIGEGLMMVNEYAKPHNALIIDIECRFYGKSVPYGNLELSSLQYLTTPEVLADYASVIASIKEKYKCSKVITFGGSYSGSLSAWMRLKYPHLIDGALASSAPVFAEEHFTQYLDIVVGVMQQKFPSCLVNIEKGLQTAYQMMQDPVNMTALQVMFNVCQPIEKKDKNLFFESLVGGMMSSIQYGLYYRLNMSCVMISQAPTPLEGMAKAFTQYRESCSDISYQDYINMMKDTDIFPENGYASSRAWLWQKCTEFGFFHETKDTSPMPNLMTFQFLDGQCEDLFGTAYATPNTDWINLMFGGYDPVVSNVFFTRGSADPWSYLASDLKNPNLLTFLIEGGSHCEDLMKYVEGSPKDVQAAQTKLVGYLNTWLKG